MQTVQTKYNMHKKTEAHNGNNVAQKNHENPKCSKPKSGGFKHKWQIFKRGREILDSYNL